MGALLPKFQMAYIPDIWLQEKGALTYLSGSPAKEPSPEAYHTELLQRETLHS
jgi:hypothetical protein